MLSQENLAPVLQERSIFMLWEVRRTMSKWVRLHNGVVAEIIPDDATPPSTWYGASFAAQCVEAPENVTVGWVYNPKDGTLAPYAPDIALLRKSKLEELSAACHKAITDGWDVILSDGEIEHFSLEETDQINLTLAVNEVQKGENRYPYHADGKLCRLYSAEDILAIATGAATHKLFHTTYCNHALMWIRRAETVEELRTIVYGAALPEDLALNMEMLLNAAGE